MQYQITINKQPSSQFFVDLQHVTFHKQVNIDKLIQQKVDTQLSNFYTKLIYMKNMCYVYPVMYALKKSSIWAFALKYPSRV